MKQITLPLLALVFSAAVASASWKVGGSTALGSPGNSAEVREVQLSTEGRSARLTAIVFPEKSFALRVLDSPSPGGTKAAQVLQAAGCVAGVNGGYFHDDYRPVGLMVSDGKEVHAFEKARLLSGVLAVRGNRIEIVRSGAFKPGRDVRQALQCGPMLVESGAPVAGLNAERIARRTVVATDGRGHWALAYITSVSLADAARILTAPGLFGDWPVKTALNLDGGSSSGLWAASAGKPVSLPEFGTVRNYLGIEPR
jgi:hypothetical protein